MNPMNKPATVAVIIPARNAAATMAETLESLCAQTFTDWIAVIAEDGSTDATAAIAADHAARDPRLSVIPGPFGSASAGRNAGLAASRSEWVLFLDSDDTLDPAMLETMLAAARDHPKAGAIHCGWRCVNLDGTVIHVDRCYGEGDLFPLMSRQACFAIHACLVRRSVVEAAGPFDPGLKTCEDTDFWVRVARTGADFIAVPQTLVTYRIRSDQSWFDPDRLMADTLAVLARIHGPDPRVTGAVSAPDGAPAADFTATAYYRSLYPGCLAIARGEAPKSLEQALAAIAARGLSPTASLDPDWCVDSFIGAIPLSMAQPPSAWSTLLNPLAEPILGLLQALERASGSPGLAVSAMRLLEARVARMAPEGGRFGGTAAAVVAADAPLSDLRSAGAHTALIAVTYGGERIGEVALPVCDDAIPAWVLADAIAGRLSWEILGRYFARSLYPNLSVTPDGAVTRSGVRLGQAPAGAAVGGTAFHDAIGWAALLQEVWGRPDWPQDRFYAATDPPAPETAPESQIDIEVGPEMVGAENLEPSVLGRVRIGGTPAGWFRGASRDGRLSAEAMIALATPALGFEICRATVREALIGAPCDGVSLAERLKAASARAAAAASPPADTLILGRWPSQQGADLDLRRAVLPSSVAGLIAEAPQEPPPSHILFAPEQAPPPPRLETRGAAEAAEPGAGVRHHFETLFATRSNPWDYTSAYEQTKYEQTLSQMPVGPGTRVLELACAEGHFTVQLAPHVGKLLAVDISETAVERARARCAGQANVSFQRLDLANEPIEGHFDIIVCSEVLYYVDGWEALAKVSRKLAAALAPGGRIVLAHANLVVDEPDETGFDWGAPFGAVGIGQTFAHTPGLVFEQELATPLYRIQRFRRAGLLDRLRPNQSKPLKALTAAYSDPEPDVARHILWQGGTVAAAMSAPFTTYRLPILMYHRIAPDGDEALARYRLHPDSFEAQLRYLREVGFTTASFDEWRQARRARRPLPGNRVILTFDDAYRDFAEHAWPLLKQYGFQAVVFAPTGHVGDAARWDERYGAAAPLMTWDEIRVLHQDGVVFGSHSVSHPSLTGLDNAAVVRELLGSRLELERQLGAPVSALCYPYGQHTPAIGHLAQACGYADAVSVTGGCSQMSDDAMSLRRVEVDGRASLTAFISSLAS